MATGIKQEEPLDLENLRLPNQGEEVTPELTSAPVEPTPQVPVEPVTGAGSLAPTEQPQLPQEPIEIEGLPETQTSPDGTTGIGPSDVDVEGLQLPEEPKSAIDPGFSQSEKDQIVIDRNQTIRDDEKARIEEIISKEGEEGLSDVGRKKALEMGIIGGLSEAREALGIKDVETHRTGKIESAQDIKTKELNNKALEDAQKDAEQAKVQGQFDEAMRSGDLEAANQLAIDNPTMRRSFNTAVKSFLGNKSNVDFFKKYNQMDNEAMQSAVNSGSLVPGSDRYNLLPESQRLRFEAFSRNQDAINSAEKFDPTPGDKVLSLDSIVKEINQGFFAGDTRTKMKEALNTGEIAAAKDRVLSVQAEIDKKDKAIKALRKDIEKEFPNMPSSFIESVLSEREESIRDSRTELVTKYKAELGSYENLKEQANQDVKFAQWESEQNKEIYMTALDLYETRRSEMREDQMATFEAENKAIAAEKKFERDLLVKEFDAALDKESKGGVYKVDRNGRQVYIKDGVSTFVTDTKGAILFTESGDLYSDSTTKEDGVVVTTRSYTDGRPPEYFTYDVNGNMANGGSTNIYNALSSIKSNDLWCGEAVNKYVVGELGIDSKDFWMGDDYASKRQYINSNTPQIGGVAIWNDENAADGKFVENGHTGVVTGYNANNGTVEITDWNWNGDKTKSTHNVKVSDIVNSDGGFFIPSNVGPSAYDSQDIPLYKSFLGDKGLTSAEQKGIKNFEEFKVKAEIYQDELSAEGTPQIEKLLSLVLDLKRQNTALGGGVLGSRNNRITAGAGGKFLSSAQADYQATFDAIVSNKALQHLIDLKAQGATFGSLTEKEFANIQNAATLLAPELSNERFNEELDNIANSLKLGLTDERIAEIEQPSIGTIDTKTSGATFKDFETAPINFEKY